MALDTDLKLFKAAVNNDTTANGGVLSTDEVVSGVAQNVWPNVSRSERIAGSTKYRKVFYKMHDDTDDPLSDAQVMVESTTPGDDWIVASIGTASDTQADILAADRKYGCAVIQTNVTAGTSTVIVTVEDVSLTTGNDQIFQNGDSIRITDMANPDSLTGNYEDQVISGAPTVSGNDVTITIASTWANSYTVASDSRVMTLYEPTSDIQATQGTITVTSSAGTYDDTTYPIVGNNRATIDTTVTLTFTDASNFTAASPDISGMASGNITTNYAPVNSDYTLEYFTLDFNGFGGTFVAGDTIAIPLNSATIAKWGKRVVPAACDPLASNKTVDAWNGETV